LMPALAYREAAYICADCLGKVETRVDTEGLVCEPTDLGEAFTRHAVEVGQSAEVEVIGADVVGRLHPRLLDLLEPDAWLDRADHALGHLVLQVEDVTHIALEPIGPDMVPADCVHQLSHDTDPGA